MDLLAARVILFYVVTATAATAMSTSRPPSPEVQTLGSHILAQYPDNDEFLELTNTTEPLRLGHLCVDKFNGRLYVGGVNRLMQLDSRLQLEASVKTGPKHDNPQCHATGCDSPDMISTSLADNVNKILVLDLEAHSLIACGSVAQGACTKYKMSNISSEPEFIPESIAANDESASTYAFIGPEHYNPWGRTNVLYVGTTFTNNGEFRHDVPAISSRHLHSLHFAEYSFSKQSLLRIDVKYRDHFLVKYVYGFNVSDYAYFAIVQKQSPLPGQEEQGYVSRLARTCINDANYDSYTEVTVQCESRGVNYNLVQDAKVTRAEAELATALGIEPGESVLVAAFAPSKGITNEPQASTALCVYSLQDIEAKFNENIHMCFNGSIKYRNMDYVSGLILEGKCPMAGVSNPLSIFSFNSIETTPRMFLIILNQ